MNRTYLFIAGTSLALFLVLLIQVNWIVQSAKVREELFNERANLVLSKTAEALSLDKATCTNLRISNGSADLHTVDSLFRYYMKWYNFRLDYHFEIGKASAVPEKRVKNEASGIGSGISSAERDKEWGAARQTDQPGCYKTCIPEEKGNETLELKLVLPAKAHFIREEMGIPFITSVILILLVLVMFWQAIVSLHREKMISEHTADFLNNMTHEFKTPLTNIALAGKMITREPSLSRPDKTEHFAGIILEENEKLQRQVEQVLSMTALERGEIPVCKVELDLHQVIQDAVRCMSLQIGNQPGIITVSPKADHVRVRGDKIHLTNAVSNLIDNALKYSHNQPRISISTTNVRNRVVVEITDNGIGIESKYLDKVFDKFFRVPTGDTHDVKGFGLGLAYVKRILELHEGSIVMRSQPGAGTTITLTLPYV